MPNQCVIIAVPMHRKLGTERRQVQFLAWTGALTRLLKDLGLQGVPQTPPSLSDVMRKPSPQHSVSL